MPRGSRPGERRGGRKPGTPNKKTLLKNAVFLAAAQDPNRSPLDFMLALMRDPQVDLDERIDLATKAAPFVHARPAPIRAKASLDLRDESGDFKYGILEPKADTGQAEAISPLDFLLGVMADPTADSEQRVKAAAVAARYKHALPAVEPEVEPTVIVVEDKFGLKVDPELARAERDDRYGKGAEEGKTAEEKQTQFFKRRAERLARVQYPEGYTIGDLKKDHNRLEQLWKMRFKSKKLTPKEDAEEAHLAVRILNPKTNEELRASRLSIEIEWPTTRIAELDERILGGETLAAAEEVERQDLRRRYPDSAAQADRLDHRYRYWLRKEREIAEKAGMGSAKALQAAEAKCEALRDLTKIADADVARSVILRLRRLESLRFDELLTLEEVDELEELHRRYPERAGKARKFVRDRLFYDQARREAVRRAGGDPGPLQGNWPRSWTTLADNARSRTSERVPREIEEFTASRSSRTIASTRG